MYVGEESEVSEYVLTCAQGDAFHVEEDSITEHSEVTASIFVGYDNPNQPSAG